MLTNYLKIAFRNILKSKGYTLINITGLAAGMACALVIFLIINHETGYDKYLSEGDRIFRVETKNLKESREFPGTYTGMVNALRTEAPEAALVAPLYAVHGSVFYIPGSEYRFKESFVFAGNETLRLLDYHWISGNAGNSLSQPNKVVISRAYAMKYFGTTAAVGKSVRMNEKQDLQVAGVFEDAPAQTSFPFNMLVSFPTLKSTDPDFNLDQWNGWGDNFQVYVKLGKGSDSVGLASRFPGIIEKHMGKEALSQKDFVLNPLSELHYTGNLSGRSANVELLQMLSLIGLFVLLIACFNFINLSTAQAFKRGKEVGLRKAVGSSRLSLVFQFLTEAGLLTFLAVAIAIMLVQVSLPSISDIMAVPVKNSDLFTWQTALCVTILATVTTLLAGTYPAFRLSGMAPIWALKSNVVLPGKQLFSLRQGLVVVQFTISIVLISSAVLVNQQLKFFRNADLGFDKQAIVTVSLPDNNPSKLTSLRSKLTGSSQIKNVSFSFNSASAESNWMQAMQYRKGAEPTIVKTQMKMVDPNFLETYGIKLMAGQFLNDGDTMTKVVVNEVFLSRIGIKNPEDAIGQMVYYGDEQEFAHIIGVVENFNVNSLHQKIDPTILSIAPKHFYQAGIKLQNENLTTESMASVLAHIEKAWKQTYPNQIYEYQFLDDTLAEAYRSETRTGELIQASTFLAVFIACLGLLGLATFTAEQKTKEIGIRKVLGASVSSIISLLSTEFLKLLIVATIIASPLAWWAVDEWLSHFEFRIQIQWWIFALTGSLMTILALITVSAQSIKAALVNPVRSLRSE
ncbi:ABC transporter permease [Dyadobacter sp. CY323]|uniref:ABC transporter permease n=1 Tax=Dyadobacter sp. CY323 TaxID=2907302 RepID=UPI001F15F515|nr:ABC transporter permease [Dyadobacter sp. CY323]MCE6992421.1 ABC transporter permease [Dyadobacter sp. CY323]